MDEINVDFQCAISEQRATTAHSNRVLVIVKDEFTSRQLCDMLADYTTTIRVGGVDRCLPSAVADRLSLFVTQQCDKTRRQMQKQAMASTNSLNHARSSAPAAAGGGDEESTATGGARKRPSEHLASSSSSSSSVASSLSERQRMMLLLEDELATSGSAAGTALEVVDAAAELFRPKRPKRESEEPQREGASSGGAVPPSGRNYSIRALDSGSASAPSEPSGSFSSSSQSNTITNHDNDVISEQATTSERKPDAARLEVLVMTHEQMRERVQPLDDARPAYVVVMDPNVLAIRLLETYATSAQSPLKVRGHTQREREREAYNNYENDVVYIHVYIN
jgi:hypothetical protein